MSFRRYVSIPPGDWSRLQFALEAGDLQASVQELLGLALHDEDGVRVQDECLRLLDHPRVELRQMAATGLGHVARLHGVLSDRAVAELLWLVDDPELGDYVSGAMDDYQSFVERDRPMRESFRPRHFVELFRRVGRLALPAGEQVAHLERIGAAPLVDALALDFDESMRLVPEFGDLGWLTSSELMQLAAIDNALEELDDDLWDVDALRTPEWTAVRDLAQEFLTEG